MSQIEVVVHAADDAWLSVIPSEDVNDCPKCQAGEGCGARPWFRGLFRNHSTLRLPQTNPPLMLGDRAILSLSSSTLNQLSFFTYGLPLLLFILTLALSQHRLNEGAQLLLASSILLSSGYLVQRRNRQQLRQQLILRPIQPPTTPTLHRN